MRINYCPENLCILRSEFVSSLSRFLFRIFRQIKDVNEEAAISSYANVGSIAKKIARPKNFGNLPFTLLDVGSLGTEQSFIGSTSYKDDMLFAS